MPRYKTIIPTLLVMILWGSLFPTVKLGYEAYAIEGVGSILLFAGVRFTVCGVIICLFALIRDKSSFAEAKPAMPAILLSGLFAIILHYAFTYTGLSLTDSSKTAIMKQIGALLYVCFSFLFFRDDRLTVKKLLGAILGFTGIVAINYGGGRVSFNVGDLLIISASFCTVFSNVIGKKALARVKPVTMTGISQLFGGVVLLIAGLALGGSMSFPPERWYIFAYICAASTVSYCIWFTVVKSGELSRLFIIKFAEPIFACVFGAILLGENVWRLQYLVAFLLISGGIVVTNLKESTRPKE